MINITAKNCVDYIMQYEDGTLGGIEAIKLFQYLIDTGKIESLQGHYGRTAEHLIERGVLKAKRGK